MIWRPILEGAVTLQELKTSYTGVDLLILNELLDWKADCEWLEQKEAEQKMKAKK